MYVEAMVELKTRHKGCGLFVLGTKAIEEWILLGPFTGTLRRTSEVQENQKEYTLEATKPRRELVLELVRSENMLRA